MKNKCICCNKKGKELILDYYFCDKCFMLCNMTIEGFIKNNNKDFKKTLKKENKENDIKKPIYKKEIHKKSVCGGCENSFLDFKTKSISCVDNLDPNTCDYRNK